MFSPVEKFDLINFYFFNVSDFWDFSMTNMSLYLIFVVVTLMFFFFFFFLYSNFVPGFVQICIEVSLKFMFGLIDKQVGYKGYIYFPFIFSLFYFILFCNLYGITPFSFAPTSHLVVTFFFSSVVWFAAVFMGFYENGLFFFKLFVPNVPKYMLPFLVMIEVASYVMRIFSLALRLSANMTSGHVLMFTMSGFSMKLFKLNWIVAFFSCCLLLFVFILEFGIAFLQAYVFVTLACIYFNDSLNMAH